MIRSAWRLLLLALLLPVVTPAAAQTEVRFLDVGQGDAVLIRSQGKTALIDTGPANDLAGKLRGLGVRQIDLLVITHPHLDHLGGADAVIGAFPVKNFMDNGVPHTTRAYRDLMRLVEERGLRYLEASERTIQLGDATLRILPAPAATRGDENLNNQSIGVIVEQGSFRALLTGDSEIEELQGWLAAGVLPDVDVLKAPHHGSTNGVPPALLSVTKPEVVVISLGSDNTYGHPHTSALRRYQTGGRRIIRTDQVGDVVVEVQPDGRYQVHGAQSTSPSALPAAAPRISPVSPADAVQPQRSCCRTCNKGKACGNGCIAREKVCRQPVGCACNAGGRQR